MTLIVGTDEAGYGPNLGPLVVAATVWRTEVDADQAEARCAAAAESLGGLWGDSKTVFRDGGFAALERGALAGVAVRSGIPRDWRSLLAAIEAAGLEDAEWWAAAEETDLPRKCGRDVCVAAAERASAILATHGLRLVAVQCRAVNPREFNALLASGLNKSDILSRITLELAAAAVASAAGKALVWCDRHGGRRRYAPLVSRAFASALVQVERETADRSAYRIPAKNCRIEFSVRGESRLPVAVASMTAKYVRELAMAAFNAWWGSRGPGLRPTAGYPLDAARWREDAAATVQATGIPWTDLWRRS